MLINIVYFTAAHLSVLRRDFLMLTKHTLEACGHEVLLSNNALEGNALNLILRAYDPKVSESILANLGKVRYGILNTEVIAGGVLNHEVNATDYSKNYQYEQVMKHAEFVWEVIYDNMARHAEIGTRAFFYRWGYLRELEEIRHLSQKDHDFYLFASDSPRRREIVQELYGAGLKGAWDFYSPYFLRNSGIARAKLQLNIISHDVFTHVNSFRICYLAGNRCAVLSEPEIDPVGYLDYAEVCERAHLAERIRELGAGGGYQKLADRAYDLFRQTDANRIMHELLRETGLA